MLSIANRLALLFGAITLGVIAVVYVYVVPPLESALRAQRLSSLAATAQNAVGQVRSDVVNGVDVRELNRDVRAAGDASSARVTLLTIDRTPDGLQAVPTFDSTSQIKLDP